MNKIVNQHGDVLLHVAEIPNDAKQLQIENGFVLERGEGIHTHIFPSVEGIEVFEKNGDIYVRVSKQTELDHEEHGRQVVKPGTYKRRIERVWDYETQEARRTVD